MKTIFSLLFLLLTGLHKPGKAIAALFAI